MSFRLGGFYYGPAIWLYFDVLRTLPQFRYVLIVSEGGDELVGILDAATLAAYLDPANTVELRERRGQDYYNLPQEDEVPQWSQFAELLRDGALERLQTLPSFRPAGEAVSRNDNSLEVLAKMNDLRADLLPVVDDDGSFMGIVDRSRLTTRVLLEIAVPRN